MRGRGCGDELGVEFWSEQSEESEVVHDPGR